MSGDISRVKFTGPLAPYAEGFVGTLRAQGYRSNGVCTHLRLAAHVSRWLEGRGLEIGDLTSEHVEEFLSQRRRDGYVQWNSTRGLAPLLTYLRGRGVAPAASDSRATPSETVLNDFGTYLLEERGLAPSTATSYLLVARLFVGERTDVLDWLTRLDARAVVGFVNQQCKVRNASFVACGLRSFLRYAHLSGLTEQSWVGLVARVARHERTLPKGSSPEQARALLASCDRTAALGARDFAVLSVLTRLGLRAGEVAAMQLGDLDWRHAELRVRGKGARLDSLPLPTDVGEALALWLERRENCGETSVFLQGRAPRGGLSAGGVSRVVASACRRAGLSVMGAHQLRHSAATTMLAAGSDLSEIAQVLRHRRLATTARYAAVDRRTLSDVAQPWPGA